MEKYDFVLLKEFMFIIAKAHTHIKSKAVYLCWLLL